MKVHFILFWLCAGLSACVHQPHIEPLDVVTDSPVDTDTLLHSIAERENQPEYQETINTESINCYTRTMDLSDEPCNIMAWQNFFSTLLSTSNDHRQQQLSNLGTTDVDRLKRLLLLTHHDEQFDLRTLSVQELEHTLSRYNLPLQDFLYITLMFNKQLLAHEQHTEASAATANELQTELSATKKLLDQAQNKIDAITNIEQQLNAEGSLTNEDNSEL